RGDLHARAGGQLARQLRAVGAQHHALARVAWRHHVGDVLAGRVEGRLRREGAGQGVVDGAHGGAGGWVVSEVSNLMGDRKGPGMRPQAVICHGFSGLGAAAGAVGTSWRTIASAIPNARCEARASATAVSAMASMSSLMRLREGLSSAAKASLVRRICLSISLMKRLSNFSA